MSKNVQDAWARWAIGRLNGQLDTPSSSSGMPAPAKDEFPVAATPLTHYTLTALPLTSDLGSSVNFSLNGIELLEDTDYTVDYSTGGVTVTAGLVAGDVISADYWTTGELVAGSFAPTSLEFWYQSSSLSLANGDPVTGWPDSSANGNNATASGSGTTFITGAVNGLPALRWASVNPFTTGTAGRTTGSWSAVVVFKASTDLWTGSKIVSSFFGGVNHSRQFRAGMAGGTDPTHADLQALEQNINNYAPDGAYQIPTDGSWHIAGVVVDTASGVGHYWLDGKRGDLLSPTTPIAGTVYSTTFTIGAGFSAAEQWTGDMAEMIGWGAALTDVQIHGQMVALGVKYGIPTS